MSVITRSALCLLTTLLLIGCDESQIDSPELGTQPTVNDRGYISPDAKLPRPESAREQPYSVTPEPKASTADQPGATHEAVQPPTPGPDANTDPGVGTGTAAGAGASGGSDAGAGPATAPAPTEDDSSAADS